MNYSYSTFVAWHESSPQNKVEIEAFSDRGARVKARKILSSLHIIFPTEKLEKIRTERK